MGALLHGKTLYNASGVAADVTTLPGVLLDYLADGYFAAELIFTNNSGTSPTLDVKIQHRSGGTDTWKDFITFTQATTGSGTEMVHAVHTTMHILPQVRAYINLGGTSPNYDVKVSAWYA